MGHRFQFFETDDGDVNGAHIQRVGWGDPNCFVIMTDGTRHTIRESVYNDLVYGGHNNTLIPMVGAGYQLIVVNEKTQQHELFPVLAVIVDVGDKENLEFMTWVIPGGCSTRHSGVMFPDGRVDGPDGVTYANKDDFLAAMAKQQKREAAE